VAFPKSNLGLARGLLAERALEIGNVRARAWT
jgi:hypothetical protein